MASIQFKLPLSKKGKRELDKFTAQNMLFDFASGNLDPEREQNLKQKLKTDVDLMKQLSSVHQGIEYASRLSEIEVDSELIEEVNQPDTYLSVLLRKSQFEKWPISVKWGIEASIVMTCIALFLVVIPWDSILRSGLSAGQKYFTLAEVSKEQQSGDAAMLDEVQKQEPAEFADEVSKADKSGQQEKTVTVVGKDVAQPEQENVIGKVAQSEKKTEKMQSEGFLYRGTISVTNLGMTGAKITEFFIGLGARKAGEVDLGWNKSPTTKYYHFTLPEAKLQDLSNYLNKFGKLQISKEKHPRIMKEGIIRLIITVEESTK